MATEPTTTVSDHILVDYDGCIIKCTTDVLDALDENNLPSLEETKISILEAINEAIAEHNYLRREWKWRYERYLPNYSIAMVLCKYHVFKCINWSDAEEDEELSFLGMFCTDGPNEGVYCENEKALRQEIYRLNSQVSDSDIKEIKRLIRDASEHVCINRNPDLIAVNNGIFSYTDKILLPFDSKYIFASKCRVDYKPVISNPVFRMPNGQDWDVESWIESMFDNPEMVELIFQMIGMAVRPHVRWDMIVMLYNTAGCNGKGTICSLIESIVGEKSCAHIPFDSFGNDAFLEQLIKATANIVHENEPGEIGKAKNLKAITTGDNITINRKYKQSISLNFSGANIQCINELPRFNDKTSSMYRRLLIVPFTKSFKDGKEIKEIKSQYVKDEQVKEYVLHKVLHMDYYELNEPEECLALLDTYKEINDPVRSFCNEILEQLAWNFVPQSLVYDIYKAWYKENYPGRSGTILGRNKFYVSLRSAIYDDYSDKWEYPEKRFDTAEIEKMIEGPEVLIARFGLTKWMNSSYKGADVEKLCIPDTISKCAGLMRI